MRLQSIQPVRAPEPLSVLNASFLDALRSSGFEGDIGDSYADRSVLSTDNSIYQYIPQAAVYPRSAEDVQRVAKLLAEERFQRVKVAPRGGLSLIHI